MCLRNWVRFPRAYGTHEALRPEKQTTETQRHGEFAVGVKFVFQIQINKTS